MLNDNSDSVRKNSKKKTLTKKKKASIFMSLLPLSACVGGGGSSDDEEPVIGTPVAPTPLPDPDFIEISTNVFVADDNSNSVFSSSTTFANLSVTGKNGNDSISTSNGNDVIKGGAGNDAISSRGGNDTVSGGSGNDNISTSSGSDKIRGGEGRDTINAGSGNDVIVVVGTTSANQYNSSDITNPAGSGINLSDLITLADLNGRTVSEVIGGEIIDGGTGTDTLFIYGTINLTGVTLNNLTILEVNSNVTLTADQISQFTKIDGDGTSTINIQVPPGDTYILDLSSLNLTDVGSLNISGDVKIIIDDANDLDEINNINTSPSSDITVEINGNGGSNTNVNLGDIADVISSVDEIEINTNVNLIANNANDITNLGLSEITGGGEVDTAGNAAAEAALDNVAISIIFAGQDTYTAKEDEPFVIFIDDLLNNDRSENAGDLSVSNISLTSASASNADIEINYDLGTITVSPDPDYNGTLYLNYLLTDDAGVNENGIIRVNVAGVSDAPTGYGSTAIINVGQSRELSIDGKIFSGNFLISSDGEKLRLDDVDSSNSSIRIRVESISGGTITRNGSTVTEFTYDDVANRRIEFDHNGSNSKPTLTLSFSNDGSTWSNPTDVHVSVGDINEIYGISTGGLVPDNFDIPLNRTYILDADDQFFAMDDINGTVTNNGSVSATGSGNLVPFNFNNIGTFTNNGYIEVNQVNGISVAVNIVNDGEIINNGLISTKYIQNSANVSSYGIFSKDVTNTGIIFVDGVNSIGILSNSGLDLNNSGTIYVDGSTSAIGVGVASVTSDITNSGNIIVHDNSDSNDSIGLDFQTSIATLNNSGLINADIAIKANYSLDLYNTGEIIGDIDLSIESNRITNFGSIHGNVTFGNKADILNNDDGVIDGVVDGAGGDDLLFGGAAADYIDGGSGNDFIGTGTGGADIFAGGSGDDTFGILHLNFKNIDGGTGKDTFEIFKDNTNLDFNSFDANKIQNIEEIEFSADNGQLSIDADHLEKITDSNNKLYINGDNNDTVNSNDAWTMGASEVVESNTYQIYTSGNATLLVNENITFNATILNATTPTISINDISANEIDETDTFTVTLSESSSQTITVDYTAPDGTIGTLTFNPGDTQKTFTTTWTDDNTDERNQVVNANLSNPTNATISDSIGQLTIIDDDGAPSISINDISTNEADGTDTFTVTLSNSSGNTITVDYTAPDGSNGTLTFNPGDTQKTFTTAWTDDSADEDNEISNATLTNPTNASIVDGSGQLTIVDDDAAPTISIDDISANEADETDTFTVTLSKASGKTITVDYSAPDGTNGTLTFNPGDTQKSFATDWIDDNTDEANETANATLSSPTNATIADGTGQLTILDDDDAPLADFIESPANTFTAIDDSGRTLDESDNENNLTVFGGGGNDTITTGSGLNTIDGGAGADILNGGIRENIFIANQDDNSFNEDTFNGETSSLDTLIVKGNSADTPYEIDLANLNSVEIDRVILDYDSSESLNISLDSFADMRENSNFIRFVGDDTDTISTSDNWQFSGVTVGYDEILYRYFAQDGNNFHSLYISMEIGTLDGFEQPTTAGFTVDAPNTYSAENDEESAFSMGQSDQDITITSGLGRTYIATGSGNDTIDASASIRANITSGAGDDNITGTSGRDYIRGSEGADIIDGGDDTDTVSYYRSQEGVTVNLNTGVNTGGYADGDTLTNIETINGSNFDDNLTGDDGDNNLYGERGDDTIYGLGGNDYIITSEGEDYASGGSGDDTFAFSEASSDFNGQFDGGDDYDTINLRSSSDSTGPWEIDVSEIDATNFETIVLEGGDGDSAIHLTISVDDVINLTDANNTLYITSNSFFDPSVHEINTASNWTYIQTITYNGDDYLQYQSGGATLNIEISILTQNGFPMPATNFTETDTNEFTAPDGKFGYFIDKENVNDLTLIAGDDTVRIESGKGNDTITVEDSDQTYIDGGDGNDTITITNSVGYESITFGGKGNDTITGGGVMEGGAGADILNGSTSSPSGVAYVNSSAGITIDFINNTASGGDAQGDTISNISYLIGSDFDDHITLTDNTISLSLGKGNDTVIGSNFDDNINGSIGADTIDGGAHSFAGDTVDYAFSDEGVTINLTTNTFSGGYAEGDTVTNVEIFKGSYIHANHFTGDANDNQFYGGSGDDTFIGMGGNDTFFLDVESDNDTFDGGEGFDIFNTSFYGGFVPKYDFSEHDISNMEALHSTGSGREFVFSADDIVNITDGDNKFIFKLATDDVLTTTNTWTQGATEIVDGVTYDIYTSGSATILINDDYDFSGGQVETLPTLSINDISTLEGDESDTFTVTLSEASTETVTVDFTAPDGSNGTLTFNPGDTFKTFTTTWTDDTLDELTEDTNATLSNPSNATIADGTGVLSILNDDSSPTISIGDISANEADETDTFTVTLSKASGKTITVDYAAPDGSNGTLTFNPGDTQKTFDTSWTDDGTDEVNEIANATLTNPTNATIADGSGQLTIIDDDNAPTISINDISANEADETDTFTVALSRASGKTITVDYTAPDGTNGTLTFNPGDTQKTFDTSWTDDNTIEADETVNASLSNPTNATIADNSGQLTIINDDFAQPSISVNDIEAFERDETANFTVTLSQSSASTVTVDYSFGGLNPGTLTFNPGETEKTVAYNWTDDDVGGASFGTSIMLSNPTNAAISDNEGDITIWDDDYLEDVYIKDDLTVSESAETASFTVRLVGEARRDISVDYSLTNGDSGTVNFAVGEQEKTITVNWTNDTLDESNEIITATLSNPVWAQITDGNPNLDGTATLTITDDDSPSAYFIDDATHNEADESASFRVFLSKASGKTITLDYDGPYGSNGTLTFNPGETEKFITVNWTDDAIVEADENHSIILSNPTNAVVSDGLGRLIIFDDDGGLTTVSGTSGDDLFAYTNIDNTLQNAYYGGEGTDTFRLSTNHVNDDKYTIDLADLTAFDMEIIELGDTTSYPGEEIIFTAADITRITDSNNTLIIKGGFYDTITTSSTWSHDSTEFIDGIAFNVYSSGSATIKVSTEIGNLDGISPTNDYTESPSRTFTAISDADSFFLEPKPTSFLTIFSKDGDDIIIMGSLNDIVWGAGGDDYILLGGHNDFVNGGSGADTMDGGGNDTNFLLNDRLSYDGSSAGVTVNLLNSTASGGDAQGDQFLNFEELEGSGNADTLTGDNNDNIIEGGAGADILDGGSHGDIGDILDYQNSSSGVTVNIATSTSSGGDAQGDTFSNFENIRGSAHNDVLTGDSNDNILIGNGGEDTIDGGAGDDTILVNTNNISASDSYDGGTGTDTLEIINNGSIDLSSFNASNIEEIGMGTLPYYGTVQQLDLTLQDVIDVTDGDNILQINGGIGDTLNSTGQGWVQGSDQVIDSETYHTYTSGTGTLLIDEDIVQTIT